MKVGIVGMPNAGKSSLFSALTGAAAEAANYPFTTIEPNIAVVPVEDVRMTEVAAHTQAQTHHYMTHFPPHPARTSDPHYVDFNAYHKATRATARCYIGERIGYGDCMDAQLRPCPPPPGGGTVKP